MLAERWQHSPSTISAVIHEVLGIVTSDAVTKFLMVRYNTREVQPQILQNKKFSPFFDNCIGAIDGTHIPAVAPENEQLAFRNRKGTLTQNVLGVVNFDLTFQYTLTGWEGSAHDGKVFRDALTKGLNIPVGKYYLGDAGYALKPYCLTPYCGTRYHLKEFARAQEKPQTKEELFNLRHSSLRSAVERTFGIVKKRFPILKAMNCRGYSFPVQAKLVVACFGIHNFIRVNQGYEDEYDIPDEEEEDDFFAASSVDIDEADDSAFSSYRDDIASRMWLQYRRELMRRASSFSSC
jgi:hypothetical protein